MNPIMSSYIYILNEHFYVHTILLFHPSTAHLYLMCDHIIIIIIIIPIVERAEEVVFFQ